MKLRTQGISNKLINTLYGAIGAQLTALLVTLAATGEFDRLQWAQIAGLAITAVAGIVSNHTFIVLWAVGGTQLVAVVVTLAASGSFDRAAWAQLAGVVLTAGGGIAFGYRAKPDKLQPTT